MPSVLIVGATRGLGAALTTYYSAQTSLPGTSFTVYGTTRSSSPPSDSWAQKQNIHWLTDIDLEKGPDAIKGLTHQIHSSGEVGKVKLSTVIITAGYFATEDYGASKWDEEVKMYTLSSVAPVFVVEGLDAAGLLLEKDKDGNVSEGSKIILVSSESGSIKLRHEQEGGGNYGHHGSKAAVNMVGRQLSFDLKGRGLRLGLCILGELVLLQFALSSLYGHGDVCADKVCSFMRTEMTAGVGFDKFWDDGGALPPDEAAKILADWVEKDFNLKLTGTYWAPRGTRDIGNWEVVMGKGKLVDKPVQLPW